MTTSAPNARDLLDAWECGVSQPPTRRALLLLAAAHPDTPPEALADLSIGRRDARLLALRERIFGPRLDCLAACPGCGERLEMAFDVAEVLAPEPDPPEPDGPLELEVEGHELTLRLPSSLDLEAAAGCRNVAEARAALIGRCVVRARSGGRDVPAAALPPAVIAALADRIALADPQADVRLALACPACGHRWDSALDIASYLWAEVDAWAQRVLREVHLLAWAYGWSERGHPRHEPRAATDLPRDAGRMSDIFGNLASRLLEPARLVQPRLPSLFEPVAATGWAEGTPGPDSRRRPGSLRRRTNGAEPPTPVAPPSHRAGRRRSLDAVTATAPQAEPAVPPIRDRTREEEPPRPVRTAQSEADPLHTVEAPQAAPAGPVVAPPLGAVSAVHPPPPADSAAAPRSTARPRDVTTAPVARTPVPESLSDTPGPPVPKPASLAVPARAERLSEEHAIGEDFGVTVEVEPGGERWRLPAATRLAVPGRAERLSEEHAIGEDFG